MQAYGRMKRVTDPFDDKVKARITGRDYQDIGCLSSGSEHSAHAYDDASCSFSDLIFGLPDDVSSNEPSENDTDSDKDVSMYNSTEVTDDMLKPVFCSDLDLFMKLLSTKVTKALELFSFLKSNKPILRRNVMTYLRYFGYNAAICKTKWESSGGLKAGNYEFIDVIRSDSMITRYVIDLDFSAELEIARPTNHYERLLQSLPNVFVGKSEELKQILKVMNDAGRRSLRSKDLHIPLWRKHRFMLNKWLGAYKRTTNILPSLNSSALLKQQTNVVKCRSVGFNAAVNSCLLFPAATSTKL
ncbi:hypothetical protein RND71_014113 [Anisodus tanguticus]|uniref:Uncharacterized protein n=1 Tax=Anisodus tanguticus TaxID=243964 RepID=A0AAE1VDW5_9SOLA|nr:hypothetical protein RND71_014113 [Anisodus tanguticus]